MNTKNRFSVLCTVSAMLIALNCAAQTPAAAQTQPTTQAQTPAQTASALKEYKPTGNPMFSHKFTADPAPVVIGDTLWMITSHDETAPNGRLNRNFTDRIDTTCRELEKLGCKLVERPDGMSITGGVTSGVVDSHGDHRLAMAFSLIGLKHDIKITNGEVFDVSFPNFIETMAELGFELELENE